MPLLPSLPLCTPGMSCRALMMSASPNITGTALIFSTVISVALICDERVSPTRSPTMTTSSSCKLGVRRTLSWRLLLRVKEKNWGS